MPHGQQIGSIKRGRLAALGLLLAAALLSAAPARAVTGGIATVNFKAVGPTMGVQVTPDWVLVANHVALQPGATFMNGYGSRTVAALYRAPGTQLFPNNDIALMRLAPAATLAPYLQVSATLFPEGLFPPAQVTIVSGINPFGGRGYAFSTIDEFNKFIDPDDSGPAGPTEANYLISHDKVTYVEGGDSGGGLFLGQVTDSVSPLLGITSARLEDEFTLVPFGSGFVEIAAYRSWIDATMLADTADNQALQWVSVPEPPTALLWAAGVLLAWSWTKRRPSRC